MRKFSPKRLQRKASLLIWRYKPESKALVLLQRLVRAFFSVGQSAARGDLQLNAMSLSYTTLLSFVPLLAVTFSVLKAFGSSAVIEPFLMEVFAPLGSSADEITNWILDFVDNIKVGVLGALGIAMLFYTVIALIQKIETVFNRTWGVYRLRPLSMRFANYLSVLMVGPVLVIAAASLTATLLTSSVMQDIAEVSVMSSIFAYVSHVIPILLWIGAFTFLYVFIPNTRVEVQAALVGGVVAGVLWNLVGFVFGTLMAGATNFTAIYSAFASLILFMIWLQIAWMIVLVGSSIAYAWQYADQIGPKQGRIVGPLAQTAAAMIVFDEIRRQFSRGKQPPDREQLNEHVWRTSGLKAIKVDPLLEKLQRAGLIRATDGETHPGYVPARPLEDINAGMIEQAVTGRLPVLPPDLVAENAYLRSFYHQRKQFEHCLEQTDTGKPDTAPKDQ